MLCMNTYDRQYIDGCRARVDSQLAAYRKLAKSAGPTLDAFAPVFFNTMVIVLDGYFMPRSRTLEGKDGNPLNEVRVLCTSLLLNDGVLVKDKAIKLDPATAVLGLRPGHTIAVTESDFVRLSKAFLAEIDRRFAAH